MGLDYVEFEWVLVCKYSLGHSSILPQSPDIDIRLSGFTKFPADVNDYFSIP